LEAADVCTTLTAISPREETPSEMREVPFVYGGVVLAPGDEVEVTAVRGCRRTLEEGWVYVVEGTYRLESRDRAVLLVSATATEAPSPETRSPKNPAYVRIQRGSGTFSLPLHLFRGGKPHVTMYTVSGEPFSGRYFGSGTSVLPRITWPYSQ
ncbi:MAG: hypothetical protein AAFU79_27470, partial [Myxococcota bacterium]